MAESTDDAIHMQKCIKVAAQGSQHLDFPFGAVLVFDKTPISEHYNEALDKKEVYRHAEMLVLLDGQKILTSEQLAESTLYSSVEPCPMCSFAIQELRIKRVVFGLRSPVMGGYTRWPVLQDQHINDVFPNSFERPPEVIPDVLRDDVIQGWRDWNEAKWQRLIAKGVFN